MSTQFTTHSIIALSAAIREQANAYILASLMERGIVDILPAHGAVLNALFKESPQQMNELAKNIGRKKNTVTGLINTLEERGYCRREPSLNDARVQLIFLTDQGEAIHHIQDDISSSLLKKAWENTDEQEQAACIRTLETVLRNLQRDSLNQKL